MSDSVPSPRPARPLALVTGAARGIGRAIASALAPDHDLVLTAREAEALLPVMDELRARGASRVDALEADLAEPSSRAALVDRVLALAPPIDVLVSNAGVAGSAPLHRTDDAQWARTLEINLTAPFVLARALAPGMARRGFGRIVHVASTAALKGYRYTAAYSASKGGLVALTRALAAELGSKGVTVNAVCPGFTDTDIVAEAVRNIMDKTGRDEAQARASLESFSPLGRLVAPGEVAAMVAYLVSDAAAAINGQALAIDGGETTR
ncbi:SDR family NAD(P)-dependent oxidoreductase [Paraliomyxa miuraensis]|uniref:SDR family NAD(P)-dependent oxidoreductase n=1 Tax=Paraliomyxa miuraensis TaxID=376150 RepID=UPI002259DA18|nr:SDR family NAD(P)-dependent oxidoreductase [Paraliomyxa miuraensis]MCX4242897.1 SDR family oxidoreductase [Paraliomyxa miuraensis]